MHVQFLLFSLPICPIKIFKDVIKTDFKSKFNPLNFLTLANVKSHASIIVKFGTLMYGCYWEVQAKFSNRFCPTENQQKCIQCQLITHLVGQAYRLDVGIKHAVF